MKKSILNLAIASAFAMGLTMIVSCGGSNEYEHHGHNEAEAHEHIENGRKDSIGNENTENIYACPMHPEIVGKKGDKCSKCGMDLEMK